MATGNMSRSKEAKEALETTQNGPKGTKTSEKKAKAVKDAMKMVEKPYKEDGNVMLALKGAVEDFGLTKN